MATKSKAKKVAVVADESDPRFVPVVNAFARIAGFSLMQSKSGGMRGLMLNGKSFGMSSHGRFILKLDEARAKSLIKEGIGKAFSPSPGRVMKGWLEVTSAKADWVALAKEAHQIALAAMAAGAGAATAKATTTKTTKKTTKKTKATKAKS